MTESIFPMVVLPTLEDIDVRSISQNASSKVSPAVTSLSRPGGLVAANLQYRLPDEQRAQYLKSFLVDMGGYANRFYVRDFSHSQRGVFPGSELSPARVIFGTGADHTGLAFQTGITGAQSDWQASSSDVDLSVDGFYMRVRNASQAGHRITPGSDASVTVDAYAPHVVRCFKRPGPEGRQILGTLRVGTAAAGSQLLSQLMSVDGMNDGVFVAPAVTPTVSVFPSILLNFSGNLAPREMDIGYYSMQRCALADNKPNLALYSNDFSQADYVVDGVVVSTVSTDGPRGVESIGVLTEDTSTGLHEITQVVTRVGTASPVTFAVYVEGVDRDFVRLQIETTGATSFAVFDLSAGDVESVQDSVGSNNPRALIENVGSGWYRCAISAEMGADATVDCSLRMQQNSVTVSYLGDGASTIRHFGWTVNDDWWPSLYNETTSQASAGITQSGLVLRVRGLPPSTARLLEAGDRIEINQSYQFLTRDLDSDAMGNGILSIAPGLRTIPADGDPVIMGTPLMFAMQERQDARWQTRSPVRTSAQVPVLEAPIE